jgi:hypothetical protein
MADDLNSATSLSFLSAGKGHELQVGTDADGLPYIFLDAGWDPTLIIRGNDGAPPSIEVKKDDGKTVWKAP